jgi:hypothetical protein
MSDRAQISITGKLYAKIKERAKAEGISISSLVERVVIPALDDGQVPPPRPSRRYRGSR